MREIKLNDARYLRGVIKRATVDESRLEKWCSTCGSDCR